MTPEEKAYIELKMEQVADDAAEKAVNKMLPLHVATCPYGKVIGRGKAFVMGAACVLTLLGMGLGAAVAKIAGFLK